jgi:hypothetical protein
MFAIETDTDTHSCIILHGFSWLLIRFLVLAGSLVRFPLNHEATTAGGHKTLEDGGKLFGDLLEGSFNSFIFALIKDLYKFLDRSLRVVKFLSAFGKRVTLGSEAVVLFESFLIHMLVLLQGF